MKDKEFKKAYRDFKRELWEEERSQEADNPDLEDTFTINSYYDGAHAALEDFYSILFPGEEDESHLGCPSYPNCDLSPTGCTKIMGPDVEMFGHKG